ncbi:leucine zipper protein 1 [Pelodytes ibericus]
MEHSSRHLRFKLQSLGRRLDDLEEATKNLQKAEDEVLDLQDKIIQAEGSNSSMLADVEALRKRVLKIEGKDEEVKKAEDLCRLIKEKLENEENVTRELKSEIEQLQKRMTELERLEDAFNKSKNDCTQLCLSLNEEKNMSKKLSSELETLRARLKELETSESKLDKVEQFLTSELEKIKSLTISFVNERKYFLEKEKQNEKLILDLKQQLELKGKVTVGDQSRNESNLLERSPGHKMDHNNFMIEDNLTSKLSHRVGLDYIMQSEIQTSSKNENDKNKPQEDNKIRDLNQEIEKLKNRLKHFEGVEEELKQMKEKNCQLHESYISEQNKNKQLADEIQSLKRPATQYNEVENGILDGDEISSRGRLKNERPKYKGISSEPPASKYSSRDLSPQQSRSERHRLRDYQNSDSTFKKSLPTRKPGKSMVLETAISNSKKNENLLTSSTLGSKDSAALNEVKKSKDQPSVLSRYPPAAQEQATPKLWKGSINKQPDRSPKMFGEDYSVKVHQIVDQSRKETSTEEEEIKETPSYASSEDKVNSNLAEENTLVENCSLASMSYSKPVNSALQTPVDDLADVLTISAENSDEGEVKELLHRERSSRYSRLAGNMDSITNDSVTELTKSGILNKDENTPLSSQDLNPQKSYYNRDKVRAKPSSKPQIPEKPQIVDTDNKDLEKRSITAGIHRKQYSPKEKAKPQDRVPNVEISYQVHQRALASEANKVSPDNIESTETHSHIGIRPRSYSPREALQSTVIIKPIIIEKDMKEIMSDYRARSNSEISRSQIHTTANKVSSSITFYPSDTATSRAHTEVTSRERHTSTSNIRLSANDQPVLKNNISIPFEISINKEDMLVKVADDIDSDLESTQMSPVTSVVKERMNSNDHFIEFDTVPWKRHSVIDLNHLDNKREMLKSTLRKGVLGSTEELDVLTKDEDVYVETKYRRKSVLDEEKPVRLRRDQFVKVKSSSVNSWTSPDYISNRSQSSLTAREFLGRPKSTLEQYSSGLASWKRFSIEDEDVSSRRKKYGTDKLSSMDSVARKTSSRLDLQQNQRHSKSIVGERIRQLEH